jgi:cell division protein ZipA
MGDDVELVAGISTHDEGTTLDWLDDLDKEGAAGSAEPDEESPGRLPRTIDPEVFMLNVVARNADGFSGEDIMHILLACDMRFGDMSFFHRHELAAGKGPIQFSVANMVQPGVFDIDNMADLRTPGLIFFLTLPGPENMIQAFDYMLETAQAVARNLGGDVLDETRSALTRQTLEHSRARIRDLERRMLTQTAK